MKVVLALLLFVIFAPLAWVFFCIWSEMISDIVTTWRNRRR